MQLQVKQLSPHRKDPWGRLFCVGLRSLALTSKSLRLLVRRKATRGVALKTFAQRGDEDRMLKRPISWLRKERLYARLLR